MHDPMERRKALTAIGVLWLCLTASTCQDDGEMAVLGINPRAGHIDGEQKVEITGRNFRKDIGYAIYFGNARAKKVAIASDQTLLTITPSGKVGSVDVTVRADDGTGFVIKDGFRYEDMSGSVVESLGENPQKKEGNLEY